MVGFVGAWWVKYSSSWSWPDIVVVCLLVFATFLIIYDKSVGWKRLDRDVAENASIDGSHPQLIAGLDGQPRLAFLPNERESLLIVNLAVTNSGAPSTAHDWRVYLLRPGVGIEKLDTLIDSVRIEFVEPGKAVPNFSINPEMYIQNTTRTTIPTGHARLGMLVSKTKTLTTEAFSGASVIIKFRDVLGKEYEIKGGLRVTRGQLIP